MNKAQPTVKTYQRISALLENSLKTILSKELHNTDTVHLYDVGEYWVAFEKSAFLLEKMDRKKEKPIVLYMEQHPFPIVMHSAHYTRVGEMCRHQASAQRNPEHLQFQTRPINATSYRQWHQQVMDMA